MESGEPEEFYFGLPEEIQQVLASDIDDWDDWQLESMIAGAYLAAEERRKQTEQSRTDQEAMGMALAFMAGETQWGIDEPADPAELMFPGEEDDFEQRPGGRRQESLKPP